MPLLRLISASLPLVPARAPARPRACPPTRLPACPPSRSPAAHPRAPAELAPPLRTAADGVALPDGCFLYIRTDWQDVRKVQCNLCGSSWRRRRVHCSGWLRVDQRRQVSSCGIVDHLLIFAYFHISRDVAATVWGKILTAFPAWHLSTAVWTSFSALATSEAAAPRTSGGGTWRRRAGVPRTQSLPALPPRLPLHTLLPFDRHVCNNCMIDLQSSPE